VVVGRDPGSKYDNALKMGIKTLNEDEFRKMVLKFRYKDEKKVNFFEKNCILLIFLLFFALLREGP